MYSLTKSLADKKTAWIEVVSFGTSLLTAQAFFKFGSFVVELAAFLALWWSLSAIAHRATKRRTIRES